MLRLHPFTRPPSYWVYPKPFANSPYMPFHQQHVLRRQHPCSSWGPNTAYLPISPPNQPCNSRLAENCRPPAWFRAPRDTGAPTDSVAFAIGIRFRKSHRIPSIWPVNNSDLQDGPGD